MEVQSLSRTYFVKRLKEKDIPALLRLCEGNPLYYQYRPPAADAAALRTDLRALPPGVNFRDKYYLGFWAGTKLVAALDLILGYPNPSTVFVGFFMTDADVQGKGVGSQIIGDVLDRLRVRFVFARLGYMKGNRQSEGFWRKNGFLPTGELAEIDGREIVVLQKLLA